MFVIGYRDALCCNRECQVVHEVGISIADYISCILITSDRSIQATQSAIAIKQRDSRPAKLPPLKSTNCLNRLKEYIKSLCESRTVRTFAILLGAEDDLDHEAKLKVMKYLFVFFCEMEVCLMTSRGFRKSMRGHFMERTNQ
jgi:hypothetical protein